MASLEPNGWGWRLKKVDPPNAQYRNICSKLRSARSRFGFGFLFFVAPEDNGRSERSKNERRKRYITVSMRP